MPNWPNGTHMQPYRTRYFPANALWMARLSQAVYASDQNGSPDHEAILAELHELDDGFARVVPFNANSSQACVIEHRDYVAAVFRGTDEIRDWLDNLNVIPVPGPFGKVHKGFHDALMDVWPGMRQTIRSLRQGSPLPLWLTGHSLGGAMATIAASMLVHADEPFYGVYTFGSPRCGNQKFSRRYKTEGAQARTHRFQNNNDIVTRVPARAMGYRHVGEFVYISEEGNLIADVGFWYKFLDTVRGVAADIGEPGFDAITDHDMQDYVDAIWSWGDVIPTEG